MLCYAFLDYIFCIIILQKTACKRIVIHSTCYLQHFMHGTYCSVTHDPHKLIFSMLHEALLAEKTYMHRLHHCMVMWRI